MNDQAERYKLYIQKLKTGKSSGISATFGKAADLIDPKSTEPQHRGAAPLKRNDVVLRRKFDRDEVIDAVEEIITMTVPQRDELDVVGAFYEGDQLMLIRSDFSVIPAPQEQTEATMSTVEVLESRTEPDMRISAPNGMWLWDIYYEGHTPLVVESADGTLIQRTENENLFVMAEPMINQRFPRLSVLEHVAVDPNTGNIFWQGLHNAKAGAFLNNGWQIEQYISNKPNMPDRFFATKPLAIENPERERLEVYDLEVDPVAGEVSFTMDSGEQVMLTSARLS